jgi:hypothetical protein
MWQIFNACLSTCHEKKLKKFLKKFTPQIGCGLPEYFCIIQGSKVLPDNYKPLKQITMGKVKENLLTKGFSGRIGDEIVFRQVGDRTMFAKRPRKRATLTPGQAAHRAQFQKAVYYSKSVLLDPAVRAEYEALAKEANLKSAYTAVVTDYLKEPQIASVFTDNYKGEAGVAIYVAAVDHFKLKQVTVTIKRADGTIIETGPATREAENWKYVVTQPNANVAGTRFVINANDRPGKQTTFEKVI